MSTHSPIWDRHKRKLKDERLLAIWKEHRRVDKLLEYYRCVSDLSQDELAEEIIKSRGMIARWEGGDLPESVEKVVPKICDKLGITPNQFFGYE